MAHMGGNSSFAFVLTYFLAPHDRLMGVDCGLRAPVVQTTLPLYSQSSCVEFANPEWESDMTARDASSEGRVQLLAKSDDREAAFMDAAKRVLVEYKTFGVLLSCRYSYEELKIGLWKSADQRLLLSTKACEMLEVQLLPILVRRQGEWPHDRENKPDDTVNRYYISDDKCRLRKRPEPRIRIIP